MKHIGVVGAGGIGTWHMRRWGLLPVELVGVYDVQPERASKAAAECQGRAFDSLEALLDAVDVVDVCTPTPFHKAPVLAAAAAGKDIVCEKPLARQLGDAREMIDACNEQGVRLFVAHVVRFFNQFAQAKALLDSGAIGQPGVIRTVRGGSPPYAAERPWFVDFEQSGGVVMDVGIHDIDFARWCFGDVERVYARGLTFSGTEPKDHALMVLRFRNGAIGHIESSWAYPPGGFRTGFEIAGDQGIVEFDSLGPAPLTVIRTSSEEPSMACMPETYNPLAPWDDPYYLELEHFLSCLNTGQEFLVTAEDALQAMKVALAALESMETGLPVLLDAFAANV